MLLRVCLEHQVKYGEHVGIIGSTKELGSWKQHVELDWTQDGWVCQLELPGEALMEFKFVIVSKGGNEKTWEGGNNRAIELPKGGTLDIVCNWDKTEEPLGLSGTSKADRASKHVAPQMVGDVSVTNLAPETGSSTFGGQWQGSEAVFMRSNEHRNKSSDRMWDTAGLGGMALKLVEGDKSSRNWWQKVSWLYLFLTLSKRSSIPYSIILKVKAQH